MKKKTNVFIVLQDPIWSILLKWTESHFEVVNHYSPHLLHLVEVEDIVRVKYQ